MSDDRKLKDFLTRFRPLPPDPHRGEADKIWAAIHRKPPLPAWGRLLAFSSPLAAGLLLFLAVNQARVETPTDIPVEPTAAAFVADSLTLSFLDEEDVSDWVVEE